MFHYDAFMAADSFRIEYEGATIFSSGSVQFAHDAVVPFGPGQSTFITVIVHPGSAGSMWTYTVGCAT
jgi:hypothetical protein